MVIREPLCRAEDVHDQLIENVARFRFVMMPPSGMSVIPIIIIVLFILGFGFCIIPIGLETASRQTGFWRAASLAHAS